MDLSCKKKKLIIPIHRIASLQNPTSPTRVPQLFVVQSFLRCSHAPHSPTRKQRYLRLISIAKISLLYIFNQGFESATGGLVNNLQSLWHA